MLEIIEGIEMPRDNINGVKANVAESIFNMLTQGRRYFGSAGASLTHHVNNPDFDSEFGKKVVKTGMEGERSTSNFLRKWAADKPDVVILDSVHVRGVGEEVLDEASGVIEGGDTDHVVIMGGNTVLLVDTKRWKGSMVYSFDAKGVIKRSRGSKKAPASFPGGKVRANGAKYLWKKYLDSSAKIQSVVVINKAKVFVKMDANWKKQGFRLYPIDKLESHLDYLYKKIPEDEHVINSTLVSQVAVSCIKPYDAYTRVFAPGALDGFK